MYKHKMLLVTVLAVALLANVALAQASPASAQEVQSVGLVVDYVPGQSITIVGKDGNQYQFELASPLEILPPDLAGTLGVGSYVTIIAPNKVPDGKLIAVSIVVHPKTPDGSVKTAIATDTTVPTRTPKTETTATALPTKMPALTETAIGTPTEKATSVATETTIPTVSEKNSTPQTTTSFIEWFKKLVRQLFTNQ